MNSVTVSGQLCEEPLIEHREDLMVAEFRLAVECPHLRDRVDLFTVVCFHDLAVTVSERLNTGAHVGDTGWLRSQTWQGDTGRRTRIDIVAERVDLLSTPPPSLTKPLVGVDTPSTGVTGLGEVA